MNDIQNCTVTNTTDDNENPTGGQVVGVGLEITWQDGPLGGENQEAPNGAFVETVISAALQRIEFYQAASGGKFSCAENDLAIQHLGMALDALNNRTKEREARQVEGTHTA